MRLMRLMCCWLRSGQRLKMRGIAIHAPIAERAVTVTRKKVASNRGRWWWLQLLLLLLLHVEWNRRASRTEVGLLLLQFKILTHELLLDLNRFSSLALLLYWFCGATATCPSVAAPLLYPCYPEVVL